MNTTKKSSKLKALLPTSLAHVQGGATAIEYGLIASLYSVAYVVYVPPLAQLTPPPPKPVP
jgi:hypothetical protein